MNKIIEHDKYGKISYHESAWLGKRSISINDKPLTKINNRTFSIEDDKLITLKGNSTFGLSMNIDGESIQIISRPKWYEILLIVLLYSFIVVWSNVVQLCLIVPIVGGAIGGFICGAMLALTFYLMTKFEKPLYRVLTCIGLALLTFLICFLIGLLVISALV